MKNLKKIVLAGAIVFSLLFGITEVLAAPANSSFDDQNFYNCVIDSYNKEKGTTNATTYNLSDTELGSLTKLDCYTSGKAENLKIVSTTGLEKMTGLTTLNLGENNISSIDVSKNTALT